MSNLIDEVKQKQTDIQNLQKEATRKTGRKEQLLKQLETDFQVSSRKEAQSLLVEFEEAKKENEKVLEKINTKLGEIISSAKTPNDNNCSRATS